MVCQVIVVKTVFVVMVVMMMVAVVMVTMVVMLMVAVVMVVMVSQLPDGSWSVFLLSLPARLTKTFSGPPQ